MDCPHLYQAGQLQLCNLTSAACSRGTTGCYRFPNPDPAPTAGVHFHPTGWPTHCPLCYLPQAETAEQCPRCKWSRSWRPYSYTRLRSKATILKKFNRELRDNARANRINRPLCYTCGGRLGVKQYAGGPRSFCADHWPPEASRQ